LQLKIVPLPASVTSQAPAEKVVSAGLQVSFVLPPSANFSLDCSAIPAALAQLDIICTLPGLLEGATVVATIGRVTAEAIATPPFANSGGTGSTGAVGGGGGSTSTVTSPATTGGFTSTPSGGGSVALSSGSAGTGTGSSGPGPTVSSLPKGRATPEASPSLLPVALSKPVKAGLLFWLLLLAAIAGGALVWLTGVLDATPATPCPLEERE
jgi:hypothetical protein